MKAPFFWYRSRGFLSTFLWPLGWLYGKGGKLLSVFKKPHRFSIPIISVGNIVCGGTGKTPTVLALADLLQQKGWIVHCVTRGYRGRQKGPLEVDPICHSWVDVGDEPLLLAQRMPTWVAKKRHLGVRKAIEKGAQIIILDDGHQTTSLYKDISFVVVDRLQGFGNGYVIPAGPLREELREGLKRTDALIEVGEGDIIPFKACFKARSIAYPLPVSSKRVIAFCGLGFPQKFYKMLKDKGIDLIATKSFPDHYKYRKEDLSRLQKLAKRHQAILVTTRKDLIKIPISWKIPLHVLDINIQFEDAKGIYDFINHRIAVLTQGQHEKGRNRCLES